MLPRALTRLFTTMAVVLAITFTASAYQFEDDTIPEITDRVARISDISGDVQIRRAETDTWERAALNLPIVEGDEIVSAANAHFELQFGSHKHVRVSENAYIRIVVLKDEGIALSLSQGAISARLLEFDPQTQFFEVDAPRSTIAFQNIGRYRIDAGEIGDDEVRLAVAEEGEARIYSHNAGFTLRSGRSARVFTEGRLAGEWEIEAITGNYDDFDRWAFEREDVVSKRLASAHYDSFYDRDIYGADELNDNGDWVHTVDYGYVWRPSRSAIGRYADWSPYRYGQWRWIPSYGWTWVNDEPWGWATYHHGRWFWHNGYWHWSPYGYYRSGRSWWRPALVYLTVWNSRICWYPLPYYYGYYNYNRHYYGRRGRGGRNNHTPGSGTGNPTPTPIPTPPDSDIINEQRRARNATPPLQSVPPTGVISVPAGDFGNRRDTIDRTTLATSKQVLSKDPVSVDTPPILPTYTDVERKMSPEIKPVRAVMPTTTAKVNTGAATRETKEPLDTRLRNTRMLGNRPPLETTPQVTEPVRTPGIMPAPRRTGGVERPITPPSETKSVEPSRQTTRSPQRQPISPSEQKSIPIVPRGSPPVRETAPTQRPRTERPPVERSEPSRPSSPAPPQRESKPSQRSEPRSSPPTKSQPSKPSSPPAESKGKDGR